MKLHTQLLLALVLGASAGAVAKLPGLELLADTLAAIEPLGLAFIRLITMVVVPLVIASLFVATASLGDLGRLAGIGGRTLAYFLGTTVIAAVLGLGLALAVEPGVGIDAAARDALVGHPASEAVQAASTESRSFIQALLELIPRNPIEAAARADLLPLIIAVLLFGAAANVISEARRAAVVEVLEAVNEISMVLIRWVMKLAPYAVFALVATAIAKFGVDLLQRLLVYALVVAGGLALHVAVVFSTSLRFLGRIELRRFYRSVAEALLVVFSTSSSNAALPVSMKVARENLGLPDRVGTFVLPLGATLNMNGSALYKAATVVFIAQVYGFELGAGELAIIVASATAAAVAGAGVPSSGLVTTLIVLNAVGLGPQAAAGIALVLGVERFLDMMRSTVNVLGDLTCAVYVARVTGSDDEEASSASG